MATVLESNSEGGFVFASVMEFIKTWESGASSRLFLESVNGTAFVSFGCFLGKPGDKHVKMKEKSKKKQERDNSRAAAFQAKQKENEGNPSSDDFTEETIECDLCVVTDDYSYGPTFEANIIPHIQTSVVGSVMGCMEEEGLAPLSESDFEIVDVKYYRDCDDDTYFARENKHSEDCLCCGGSKMSCWWKVKIKYRQKLQKPNATPYAVSFRRYLDVGGADPGEASFDQEKLLRGENGERFYFDKCCRSS